MKSHVQALVIGGGVVGASILYHLTKLGWKDVLLIERSELTSGSTWHAAGGMHTLNSDPNISKLQKYTISVYEEIEAISGQSCGVHLTGGVFLATTKERTDWLKAMRANGRMLGLDKELITPKEAAEIFPVMDPSHFVAALFDPLEGHIDPSGVTQAFAKAARIQGAEVVLRNRVIETNPQADGSWEVVTEQGTVIAEHVINAAGLWAREVGAMAGVQLPVLAMEHQYLLTDDIPEVAALDKELLHAIDFTGEAYMRQERKGMLLGTYEQACVPWSPDKTPWEFGHELLQADLDRIAPSLEIAFKHIPVLAEVGIRQIINGPFTFAPDGNPLIGPVPGLTNYWVAVGVMAGFSQGGGVGLSLAQWMIEGEPETDIFAMDVARFGGWATKAYTHEKVQENYRRRFSIVFPNEELPAARPMKTTPLYDRLAAAGAVFGMAYGLEHALWFSPKGPGEREDPAYRRSNAFEPVGQEARAVREGVGLIEIATYAKYAVEGPGAEAFLDRLMAGRLPKPGRIALTPMLSPKGRIIGDFTIACLAEGSYRIIGSGAAENYHLRWFHRHLPDQGVRLESLCTRLNGIAISGPKARELLSRLVTDDIANETFPFLSVAEMDVGRVPALVARISFTGELGYEIYVAPEYQLRLYQALTEAGEDLGLAHFGSRALNSLRLEKSFGSWLREYTPDYNPFEAGMGRFVSLGNDKGDFIGRAAVAPLKGATLEQQLVTLTVETQDIDALGDEPVWHQGEIVGITTSGGYGHCVGKSIAMAYVPSATVREGAAFEVEVLGETYAATLSTQALWDPKGERLRS
ncbi:MAG: FAD-dependent oxidoreductase [Rhodospirillales bacterium]